MICLDSGCGNYEQLWMTTSLRGLVNGTLNVRVLEEGVHSGNGSGIVPSSFRIARQLLSRLEDEATGEIRPQGLHAQIPPDRRAQAAQAAASLGDAVRASFPFAGGTKAMVEDRVEMVLNRTWRPQLAVIGADGLPAAQSAGNVLLPFTTMKLSLRLPPTLNGAKSAAIVKQVLEENAPYGATVSFEADSAATGWNAPTLAPWLEKSLAQAAQAAFGTPPAYMGEGGTIPFMAMLGEKFPEAQFVVTGVLGPQSNAHGPERVPAHPGGEEAHHGDRPGARGSPGGRVKKENHQGTKDTRASNLVLAFSRHAGPCDDGP